MSFPKEFLTDIARKQRLTEKETEAFLCVFGKQGKTMTRQAIADSLHIHKSTLGTRLSGIYKKFSFCDDGPGKENDLRQHLIEQLQTWQATNSTTSEDAEPNLDTQVQQVRNAIQSYIQEKCGTMRVLDMNQPIGLGEIYTHVNILERITSRIGREMADLIEKVDREQVERFCLGNIREERVSGLEAVEKYAKLIVLGKPGAGKSTFLKHLAIQCIGGKFQAARVPIFVTLKDFADKLGKPDLLTYLDTHLKKGISLAEVVRGERALLLLDGLDEVRKADSRWVLGQIEEISYLFPQNQYIITCRIAAQEYRFESFTEVEIADFDDKQIADFSGKWFGNKNDPVKAKRFAQKLKEDKPISELATSPLLLTLLCLVFEDSGSFPSNRDELHEQGIDILLRRWNPVPRERDPIYQKLSSDYREELLSHIAWKTFKSGEYSFRQRKVRQYIREYIKNLPGISPDDELKLDSERVLKSIEVQHGLLIKSGRGIYSFSHLTFHEYFTARRIVTHCNPEVIDDLSLQELASHVTDKSWREVFLLAVGMLDRADVLVLLMKERIDRLLAGDEKLQQFLVWVDEKSQSGIYSYKNAAVRAFYFTLTCGYSLVLDERSSLYFSRMIDSSIPRELGLQLSWEMERNLNFERILLLTLKWTLVWLPDQILNLDAINQGISYAASLDESSTMENEINSLRRKLIIVFEDKATLINWCKHHKAEWINKLRNMMIKYCNIGHQWSFNKQQKKLLQLYYDTNKFMLDCLKSDCYVSREVRQEIEDTLLLPIAQIEQQRG